MDTIIQSKSKKKMLESLRWQYRFCLSPFSFAIILEVRALESRYTCASFTWTRDRFCYRGTRRSETPAMDIASIDRLRRLDPPGFDARMAQNKGDKRLASPRSVWSPSTPTHGHKASRQRPSFSALVASRHFPREHNGRSSGRDDSSSLARALGFLGLHPHKDKSTL